MRFIPFYSTYGVGAKKMTANKSKEIYLFTYVNTANGYVKEQITLHDLILRLCDKRTCCIETCKAKCHTRV